MHKTGKLMAVLMALTIIISTFTGNVVFAADVNTDFTIENGILTDYSGAGGDVTIPSSVQEIGELAFYGCTAMTSVTISEGVTKIANTAFQSCSNLTTVSIPKSVTNIEGGAFYGCTKLKTITVDAASESYCVENGVLFNKSKTILVQYPTADTETTWYRIPEGVQEIADAAFADLKCINYLIIPDGVTKIGSLAFESCTNLGEIDFPDSITEIGIMAFEATPWLMNYNGDFVTVNHLLVRYQGYGSEVTIPSDITGIVGGAFLLCTDMTKVTIPSSVKKIGQAAFSFCTGLTSATLPNGLTKIDDGVFSFCTALKTVNIPSSATSIGKAAFGGCSSLTNVTIPNSVTQIGESAFESCTSLAGITIQKNVVTFGDNVFSDTNVTISGLANSAAQTYAAKYSIPFQSLLVYNGIGYKGSVMFDTKIYNMSPKNIYDIGVKLAGNGKTKTMKVVSSRDGIATVKRLSNGNYRIIGVSPGTTYIVCSVYDGTKEIAHASVKVTVTKGVKQNGVATRNTSYFN